MSSRKEEARRTIDENHAWGKRRSECEALGVGQFRVLLDAIGTPGDDQTARGHMRCLPALTSTTIFS
jgi:hypothetical protein